MEKYLQKLLKEVNTVIIPGLGALTVTNHSTGEIMFMPYLKYDDGKLSSYIADQTNSSIEEAKNFIGSKVEEINNNLENDGISKLLGVGVFSMSSSGDIEFKSTDISDLSIEESTLKEEEIITENTILEAPILDVLSENEVYTDPLNIVEEDFDKKVVENEGVEENNAISTDSDEEIIDFEEPEYTEPTEEESIDLEEENTFYRNQDTDEKNKETLVESEEISNADDIKEQLAEDVVLENDEFTSEIEGFQSDLELVDQTNKKKRGIKFWVFISLLLVVLGGGAYVGINFEKFKHLIPFISKKDPIEEKKIIEKLESDDTKPSTENISKSEEMIHSTEVTDENTAVGNEEEPIVSESVEQQKLANSSKKSVNKTTEKITTEAPVNDGSHKSFIILGTFSEQVNANNLLDKIVSQGIKSASILEREGKFSVCYGSFPTKEEAISKLAEAKSAFKSAWIFNKP
jgi:hypothetical protein